MAKLIKNTVMQGVSGIVGKTLIFRQMKNGTTVIAMRPKPRTKPITPAEAATHQKFKEAAHIAKKRSQDPVLRAQYLAKAKPGQSAYLVALTEYLNTPKTKETFKSPSIEQEKTVNVTRKSVSPMSKNANKNRNQALHLKFKMKPIKHKLYRRISAPSTTTQNYQSKSSLMHAPNPQQPINDKSQSITAEGNYC